MRLDGEEIRDSALSVSGLLVNRIGGKSVYPYQPKGLWMELNNRPGYSKEYPQGSNEQLYRRIALGILLAAGLYGMTL